MVGGVGRRNYYHFLPHFYASTYMVSSIDCYLNQSAGTIFHTAVRKFRAHKTYGNDLIFSCNQFPDTQLTCRVTSSDSDCLVGVKLPFRKICKTTTNQDISNQLDNRLQLGRDKGVVHVTFWLCQRSSHLETPYTDVGVLLRALLCTR